MKDKNGKLLPRCSFLDDNLKRCRKHSAIKHRIVLDTEIYATQWVEVNLCIDHALLLGKDFTK